MKPDDHFSETLESYSWDSIVQMISEENYLAIFFDPSFQMHKINFPSTFLHHPISLLLVIVEVIDITQSEIILENINETSNKIREELSMPPYTFDLLTRQSLNEEDLAKYEAEMKKTIEKKTYELPDGQTCSVGNERFLCPEALFRPSLLYDPSDMCSPYGLLTMQGLTEAVYGSIMKLDRSLRKHFYVNVFVIGGSSMINGFADRLSKELRALVPETLRVKVIAPPERKFFPWIGGSILGSMCICFGKLWILKEEYDEKVPEVIHSIYNN